MPLDLNMEQKEKAVLYIALRDAYQKLYTYEAEEQTDRQQAIHGVFSFIIGEDPTYGYIENGSWLNEKPYGTIHRMASDGTRRGMLRECLDYCRSLVSEIRMDTHEKNLSMQQACEHLGFQRCGVIYVADGTPRIAYQLAAEPV